MFNFCTLFDKNYLSRGIALYNSLKAQGDSFRLFVLCLDDYTFKYLSSQTLSEITPIALTGLEGNDKELIQAKNNRSLIEYYFTLSPVLPLYILNRFPSIDFICLLDADIYFFSSVKPIINLLNRYSIVITPHKFSKEIVSEERLNNGLYNVSFQVFKNNRTGRECLEYWRYKCLEWCYDYYDERNNRYADQKYLDEWETKFSGEVKVLDDCVSGLAVWNVNNYRLTYKDGKIFSNEKLLIFYHFHNFKVLSSIIALNSFNDYSAKSSAIICNKVYLPYWKLLKKINNSLLTVSDGSVRYNLNKNKLLLILKDGSFFFNLFNVAICNVNVSAIKRIYFKIKRNGIFNKSRDLH